MPPSVVLEANHESFDGAGVVVVGEPGAASKPLRRASVKPVQRRLFPSITEAAKELEAAAKAQEDLDKLRAEFDILADLCDHARAKAATISTTMASSTTRFHETC